MGEHTVAAFDEELGQIDRLIRDMGGLAGAMVGGVDPRRCSNSRQRAGAARRRRRRRSGCAAARDRRPRHPLIALRQPMAQRPARTSSARSAWPATSSASATWPRTSPSASAPSGRAPRRATCSHSHRARWRELVLDQVQGRARRLRRRATPKALRRPARRRREDRRELHRRVPRTADLHDGGSAQHHAPARICCSAPRTSSASATTPPTSPRSSTT